MIKRIIGLVVTSSLISAGLLFLGITMMEQYSPALASSLDALVAGSKATVSQNAIVAVDNDPQADDLSSGVKKLELSSLQKSASNTQVNSNQSPEIPANSISAETSGGTVTIAQLLSNPDQYRNQVITISGIATSLGDDKMLVNDGTGQILVEVDDELVNFAVINGLSITIMGMLDDFNSSIDFKLDACTIEYQNNTVVIDDCTVDDDIDDDDDDGVDDDDDDGMDDDDDDGMDDDDDDGLDDDDDDEDDDD
jgi:hypothetical protein